MSGILKRSQKSGSSFNLAATSQTYFMNKQRNGELQQERIIDHLNEFKAKYRSMCSQESGAKVSDSSPSEYTNTEAITRVSLGDASPLRIQITNSRSSHALSLDAPKQIEKDFFISGIQTPSGISPKRSNTPKSHRPMIFKYNYSPAQTDRARCLSNRNIPKSPDVFKSQRDKISAVKMLPRINIETLVTQIATATTPHPQSRREDIKSIENQNDMFLKKCFSSANIGEQMQVESNAQNKSQDQRKLLFSPSKNRNLGVTASSAMFRNIQKDISSIRKHSDPTITTTYLAGASVSGENGAYKNYNTTQQKFQTSQTGDQVNVLGRFGTDEIILDPIESQETERSKMLKEYARTQIGGRFKSPFRHPSIQRKGLESDEKILPKSQKKVTFTDDEVNNTKMNDENNFQNHLQNLDYISHSGMKSKQIRELIDMMIKQSNNISSMEKKQSEVKPKKFTFEGFHRQEQQQQEFFKQSSMKMSQTIGDNQQEDSVLTSKSPVKQRQSLTNNSPTISLLNRKNTRQITIQNHERSKSENNHQNNSNISNKNIQNTHLEAISARNGSILRTSSISSEKQISDSNINSKRKISQFERQSSTNSNSKDDFQRLKEKEKAQEIVESVFMNLSKINTLKINRVKIAKFFESFLSRNSPIYYSIFNNQNELRNEFSSNHLEKIFAAHNTNPNGQLQSSSNIFHEFQFLENKMEEFLLENQISDCVQYKQGIIDGCLSLQDVALKMRQPYQNQALNTLSGLSCNRMVNKQHSIVDSLNTATIKFGKLGHISHTQLKMNQAIEKEIQTILNQRQSQIKSLQIFPVQSEDS